MANRRTFIGAAGAGIAMVALAAKAQQAGRIYRIGYLAIAPRDVQIPFIEAFERGLASAGYVIGRDVVIEYRFADGKIERLPELAADLVSRNVDVVVTGVNANVRALQRATTTIPIVTATAVYPVEDGLVASLARPGGNVTGLTMDTGEEVAKRLELLRETTPGLTRVATLSGAGMSYNQLFVKPLEVAARRLGLTVLPLEIRGRQDLDRAFAEIERTRMEAVIVFDGPITLANRTSIISLLQKKRLPAIWSGQAITRDEDILMSYGVDVSDLFRRAAGYVDRILKGAKPAELPIEQPMKFALVINLKTARALGLTIPQSLLLRADEVIQ